MKNMPEVEAAVSEARKWGALDIAVEHGGKHMKVYFTYQAKRLLVVCPASGSDRRGPMNTRKDVRRVMGIERQATKGTRRKRRQYAAPPPAQMPRITPGKDGFADLQLAYLKTLPIDEVWRLWWQGIRQRVAA